VNKSIVLFDANCMLCSNAVRLITKYDSRERFCFISLRSEAAAEFLNKSKAVISGGGTMMLITGDRNYIKSDAVLRILKYLDGLWPLFYVFIIVPRFIRDPVYDLVAKYRYKWFGPCVDCPDYRPCC